MTGDAMARPLIEEYERKAATGTPYDASSLFAISSSAAIFSPDVKERWMAAFPNAIFTDSVGATETGFHGHGHAGQEHDLRPTARWSASAPTPWSSTTTARSSTRRPTSARSAGSARGGNVPVGYYKDPEKSAKTFLEIDGERYSVPGDFARIEEGNRITLLGRGSNCVNTGGEKVYPEEVEMAIKSPPGRLRLPRRRHPRREVRPGRRRGRPAARGHRPSSWRSCATSCAPTCRATSCRAR